ncbi:MAG: ABC transporter ATP-binding protein [Clostridiaceae bacterium]|nr:ABC transporter ATP-binding protein [Clostridiaceae bacterium]
MLISLLYYFIYSQRSYLLSSYVWKIKYELFSRIINADSKVRENINIGDSIGTIQKDSVECMNYIIRNRIRFCLFSIFVCIYMLYIFNINIMLGAVTLFSVPISLIIPHFIGIRLKIQSKKARMEEKEYTDWLYDRLQGGSDIKLLRAQALVLEQNQSRQKNLMRYVNLTNLLKKKYQMITAVLHFTANIIFLYFTAVLALKNRIFIGDLIVILAFYSKIISNIKAMLSNKMEAMQRAANIDQLNRFLTLEQRDVSMRMEILNVKKGELKLKNVCFHYEPGHEILSGQSLYVSEGQSCAVCGASGTGKTTLFKLILQQYPLMSGNIYIDDQDLSRCTLSSIFKHIGYVAQKPFIISGTVKENICFGNHGITDEMILNVCEKVGLQKSVASFRNGFETVIGTGGCELSMGQQQLLCIARTLLRNPSLILLDEPTASLDSKTGKQVLDLIFEVFRGKTILLITHDSNAAELCDIKFHVN